MSAHTRAALTGLVLTTSLVLTGCSSTVRAGPSDQEGSQVSASATATPGATAPAQIIDSVFYSPYETPELLAQITDEPAADTTLALGEWAAGNCRPDLAADNVPTTVDSIGGFSLGRLGAVYFLQAAEPGRAAGVTDVTLIDPGGTTDFTGGSCEEILEGSPNSAGQTLTDWLASSPDNQLTILAGEISQDSQNGVATFEGLKRFYLDDIIGRPLEEQLLFCDYDGKGHEAMMHDFIGVVDIPVDDCPVAPDGQTAVRVDL